MFKSRAFPDAGDDEVIHAINATLTLSYDIDKTTLKKKQQEDTTCKSFMLQNPDQFGVVTYPCQKLRQRTFYPGMYKKT